MPEQPASRTRNASFGYQKYSSSCERSAVTIEHGHEVVGVKFVEKLQQKFETKTKRNLTSTKDTKLVKGPVTYSKESEKEENVVFSIIKLL